METRASPFIVGLFTIVILAGVAAVVFWLGRYGDVTGREQYRIVFSDDVTGLNRGSSVLYNGIRVGDVADLSISSEDPSKVIALVTVDSEVPVRADTRAQLQFQGITGLAFVQLKAGDPNSPPLDEVWDDPTQPPVIRADSSSFQDLMAGAQELMGKLDTVADQVSALVSDNREAVNATVANVESFTSALAANSETVGTFLADAGAAARRLDEVGARFETLVEAVDPEAVSRSVANVETFTASLADKSDAIDRFMEDAAAVAASLRESSQRIDGVTQRVDGFITENEESVSASIRNFETFTTALAENSEALGTFMADAGSAARRLDEVGARIETLVEDVNAVVAAVEPDAVRAVVADLQGFADTLNANSERITAFAENAGGAAEKLNSFAGRLDSMADDVSRVVAAVDPAVISRTVENVDSFAASLAGKTEEFETFIDDAGAVAAQLRETSQRLDNLLVRVDGMVGEEGTGSLFADIAAAAQSFRQLTENLDSRLDSITADIERFGGGGLREFQTFMSESRQTLANLNRVISDLEKNPSGFLFGGSDVPEYTPGRRF